MILTESLLIYSEMDNTRSQSHRENGGIKNANRGKGDIGVEVRAPIASAEPGLDPNMSQETMSEKLQALHQQNQALTRTME